MNSELEKIDNYIKGLGFKKMSFSELSKPGKGVPLVADENTAYCFDKISDGCYEASLFSADALLIKPRRLYLIEFKHVKPMIGDEKEREILRLKLFLKMAESFHTLQNHLFINCDADSSRFEKHFILVTEHFEEPLATTFAACDRLSRNPAAPAGDVYKDSFGKYRQQYKNSKKKVYYDSVDIWADFVFPDKVAKLK